MTNLFPVKPLTPGAPIMWRHTAGHGETELTRTGVIWSLAPLISGTTTFWVTPDEPLMTDLYSAIAVNVPRKRRGGPVPVPESSDHPESATGSMTAGAARAARNVRVFQKGLAA
jgi:hypothetical protein